MTRIRSIQEHLNRWMLVYVSLAIVVGLTAGHLLTATTKVNSGAIGNLTTVAVFFIIYPMMVNVRFEALLKAGRNLRGIGIAILFNFLWAPLVGWVLATIFLSDHLLALGFLLVMVVPCSSMAIGYTGLAKGDLERVLRPAAGGTRAVYGRGAIHRRSLAVAGGRGTRRERPVGYLAPLRRPSRVSGAAFALSGPM